MFATIDKRITRLTITLTDVDIENAETIRLFLEDNESGYWLGLGTNPLLMKVISSVLAFANKWEATEKINVISHQLGDDRFRCSLYELFDVFILGAKWNNISLCTEAVRCATSYSWEEDDDEVLEDGGQAGVFVFDPAAIPHTYAEQIPPTYLWALAKAVRNRPYNADTSVEVMSWAIREITEVFRASLEKHVKPIKNSLKRGFILCCRPRLMFTR